MSNKKKKLIKTIEKNTDTTCTVSEFVDSIDYKFISQRGYIRISILINYLTNDVELMKIPYPSYIELLKPLTELVEVLKYEHCRRKNH